MKKITFLVENFFSKRDYKRFLVEKILKYHQVKILNFTKIYYKNAYQKFKNLKLNYKKKIEHEDIKNLFFARKFFTKISNKKNIFFVDMLSNYNRNKENFFNSKFRYAKIIQFQGETVPRERLLYRIQYHAFSFKSFFTVLNICSELILRYLKKNLTILPDVIFVTGKATENVSAKKIIYSHSFDYEIYLDNKKNIKKKKYVVFLDELMIDHPEYMTFNRTPPINELIYFERMNKLFSQIKKELKLDVLVAAHPRLIYLPKLEYYKKFNLEKEKVIVNNTINLVKDCSFVLAHASTSISFAVLFKKPILYLNFKDFSWMQAKVRTAHYLTGGNIINLDSEFINISKNFINKIDNLKYKNYFHNYIKHPKSSNKSMVCDLITYIKSN